MIVTSIETYRTISDDRWMRFDKTVATDQRLPSSVVVNAVAGFTNARRAPRKQTLFVADLSEASWLLRLAIDWSRPWYDRPVRLLGGMLPDLLQGNSHVGRAKARRLNTIVLRVWATLHHIVHFFVFLYCVKFLR